MPVVALLILMIIAAVAAKIGYNYRINRLIYSDFGRQYLALMEETGIHVERRDTGMLMELALRRERLMEDAREAGFELAPLEHYLRRKMGIRV